MFTLQDKFEILNNIKVSGDINHISVFIKNLMNKNIIFHPFLLNNILKNNIDDKELLSEIGILFDTYNRDKRQYFRSLIKKNELTDVHINNYIFEYINMVRNINSYLYSSNLSSSTFDKSYRWGNSSITHIAITSIIDVIIEDKIIDSIINKSIENNNNMYKLIKNIQEMDIYYENKEVYKNIINKIEDTIIKHIQSNCNDKVHMIKDNLISNIYMFKFIVEDYLLFKKKFNYINKDNFLKSIFNHIKNILKIIVTFSDIKTLKYFIDTFKDNILNFNNVEIYCCLLIGIVDIKFTNTDIIYNENKITLVQIAELLSSIIDIYKDDSIIKAVVSQFICDKNFIITRLVEIINNNIINNKANNIYIIISSNIKNKDIFYKLMEKKMLERLLYQNISLEEKLKREKIFFNELQKYHNINELSRYKTIINDFTNNTHIINSECNRHIYVMTENMWNLNVDNGYAICSNPNDNPDYGPKTRGVLAQYCFDVENIYYLEHNIDKLLYHLDIGYIDITIKNNKGRINVRMLPIQLSCFELFGNDKIYTDNELIVLLKKSMISYKDIFIQKVIQSLINGKLLFIKNGKYYENKDFNNCNYNFINEFSKLNNTQSKIIKKITDEITYSRIDIINANINSLLKLSNKSKQDLYEMCKKNINLFEMNIKLFNTSIKCMIDKDYIKLNENGTFSKLLY